MQCDRYLISPPASRVAGVPETDLFFADYLPVFVVQVDHPVILGFCRVILSACSFSFLIIDAVIFTRGVRRVVAAYLDRPWPQNGSYVIFIIYATI